MMRESALRYVRDFKKPVLPLCWPGHEKISEGHDSTCGSKGKRALIPGWQQYCSQIPDVNEVDKWFSKWPQANIGGPTGPIWGFAVDIDFRHGGVTSIDSKNLPETVISLTGGGGYHYLYRHPGSQVANKVSYREGIDIRGDGGYIVLPPSRHSSGEPYRWKNNYETNQFTPSDAPAWLLESLKARTGESYALSESHIPEGRRRSTLVSMAGTMLRKGMSREAIEAALIAENDARCRPPLPVPEVTDISRDIPERYPQGDEKVSRLNFMPPEVWLNRKKEPVPWLVKDLLVAGSLTMISAPPKAGKSTFARAVSAAVTTGEEFLGRTVNRGSVLFMALEEHPDTVIDSFKMLGLPIDSPLLIHTGRAGAEEIPELEQIIREREPAMVVIDTVGRLRPRNLDMSDYSSTGEWIETFMYMAHESKTCILVLHHDNKEGRNALGYDAVNSVLGSTVVGATVDQLISIRRSRNGQRTFQTIGRFGDLPETGFALDRDTQRLHLTGTPQEHATTFLEQEILKLLNECEKLSNTEILKSISGRTQMKTDALRKLVESGMVERNGSGKAGNQYFFSLTTKNIRD